MVHLPLLAAQRGVWIANTLASRPADYNVGQVTTIGGVIDVETFSRAATLVAEETEALRLVFSEQQGRFLQLVRSAPARTFEFVDLSEEREPEVIAERLFNQALARPLDLVNGPVFRWVLIRCSVDRFQWGQFYHHIAVDGIGRTLIVRRMAALYDQLLCNGSPSTPDAGSIAQLVRDEDVYVQSPKFAEDRSYWLEKLTDFERCPSFSRRPATGPAKPQRHVITLRESIVRSLGEKAQERQSSLPRLIAATAAHYLHRFTGVDDALVGFQVAARETTTARATPGMLTNTVPLRLQFCPSTGFAACHDFCNAEISGALRHQLFPWSNLRRELKLPPAEEDPFSLVVNYVASRDTLFFGGQRAWTRNLARGPVWDLQINVDNSSEEGGLSIEIDGNPERYSLSTLAAHGARLNYFLQQFATYGFDAEPSFLDQCEHERVTISFNQSGELGPPVTLCEKFAAQVRRAPDNIALLVDADSFSYAEIDRKSNRLARHLIDSGIGKGCIVAVLLGRSSELVISLLAVLKAGAAYLPLDPAAPTIRNAAQISDSNAALVLCSNHFAEQYRKCTDKDIIVVDHPRIRTELQTRVDTALRDEERLQRLAPEDRAYVIYTSGSTGQPKGVAVSHGAIAGNIAAMHEVLPMSQEDTLLCNLSMAFDTANGDLFLALLSGAKLAFPDDEDCRDPHLVAQRANEVGATVLDLTPSFWRLFPKSTLSTNLRVMIGGEIFPADLVDETCERNVILNCYGPTEATITTSVFRVRPLFDTGPVPIGRPLRGYRMYILGRDGKPQPVGAVGELWIAGQCLAEGYIGDEAMTASRFQPCPFGNAGDRMYRSGDLAYWREDGVVAVIGRADEQLKINGYRIEPGEIEHVLCTRPGIAEAAVVQDSVAGRTRLVAYLVPRDRFATFDASNLRADLASLLPVSMIPSVFATVESLPRTLSGKLNRRRLPKIEHAETLTHYVAPRTPLEAALCGAFARTLGIERVGVHDNLFEAGADSLLTVLLTIDLKNVLGRSILLGEIFDHQTPAELAKYLERSLFEDAGDDVRQTVFLIPGMGGDQPQLSKLRLGSERHLKFVTLELPHWSALIEPGYGLPSLVAGLAEQVRKQAKGAPVAIVGYSLGGVIAYALAESLSSMGDRVARLAILDTDITRGFRLRELGPGKPARLGTLRLVYWAMGKAFGRSRDANRAWYLATAAARPFSQGWGVWLLRILTRFRSLPAGTPFRNFFHYRIAEELQVRLVDSWLAVRRLTPRPLSVPTVLFVSREEKGERTPDLGWQPHCGAMRIVSVEGDHSTMFNEPHLASLCEKLIDVVESANQDHVAGAVSTEPV